MRVLIVDDHRIVASGCRALFADDPEIDILEASDAESGERVFGEQRPDICVLDINLPTVSGFELARRILGRDASARIIMFSMNDDPVFAARAIEIGAKGYVSKTGDPQDLVEAIREVAKGGVYLPPAMARSIAFCGILVRPEPAFKTDLARDGDIAPAQCRKKPVRNRVAGPFLLQDGRQHFLDHAPEARRAHIRRTGAVGNREPRGLRRRGAVLEWSIHDNANRFSQQIARRRAGRLQARQPRDRDRHDIFGLCPAPSGRRKAAGGLVSVGTDLHPRQRHGKRRIPQRLR